jgi:excisionase family DNA binding protein
VGDRVTTVDIDSLPPARPKLLTPRQCADRWSISVRKVQDYLTRKQLTGIRFGKLWRVREEEADAFLKKLESGEVT